MELLPIIKVRAKFGFRSVGRPYCPHNLSLTGPRIPNSCVAEMIDEYESMFKE